MLHQLSNGGTARPEIGQRKGLGLVENDDAAGQIVELSATGGPIGEEGFEKLDSGGDHQWRAPVLGGQQLAVFLRGQVFRGLLPKVGLGVMGKNVFRP